MEEEEPLKVKAIVDELNEVKRKSQDQISKLEASMAEFRTRSAKELEDMKAREVEQRADLEVAQQKLNEQLAENAKEEADRLRVMQEEAVKIEEAQREADRLKQIKLDEAEKRRFEGKLKGQALVNKYRWQELINNGINIGTPDIGYSYDDPKFERKLAKAEARLARREEALAHPILEQAGNENSLAEESGVGESAAAEDLQALFINNLEPSRMSITESGVEGPEQKINSNEPTILDDDENPLDEGPFITGDGLKRKSFQGQSEHDLNDYLQDTDGYIGSCTIDEIADYADDLLDSDFKLNSLIVNTLPRSSAGKEVGHWVAILTENDLDRGRFTVMFYDPLGDPCSDNIHSDLQKIVERQPFMYEFKSNLVPTQDEDSSLCGFHCVQLIKSMVRGIPWRQATHFDEAIAEGRMLKETTMLGETYPEI